MNKNEKIELSKKLNSLPDNEIHTYIQDSVNYKILIIFRGEGLFYSESGRSLIFENFSARDATLFIKGINKWLDGTQIEDRKLLERNVKDIYRKAYKDILEIIL